VVISGPTAAARWAVAWSSSVARQRHTRARPAAGAGSPMFATPLEDIAPIAIELDRGPTLLQAGSACSPPAWRAFSSATQRARQAGSGAATARAGSTRSRVCTMPCLVRT